ncbi:MAG TPA: hypothetical protein PLB45_01185 [Bacilli bacterium]|nr:hypothetical protein [Bacilli bacterium]HPZ24272.1 hypothetical protein [Bacilli bacterium]HQC83472.1 hypothetical protein [Bacilli bacterium]
MNKDNNYDIIREINNIENSKSKYAFTGFLVGIIPFFILVIIIYLAKVNIQDIDEGFKSILSIGAIITSLLNAVILSNMAYKKLISFFEWKYNCNYKEIKDALI